MGSTKKNIKRVIIGIAGTIVLLIGLVTIPYPGPGWLTVIAGLAILATEFDWAKRILEKTKEKYERWQQWMKRQSLFIKVLFWLMTLIVVTATIWLLNGYGLINDWFNLGYDWVRSPLPIFN
ncbi:MAG TPA: TIGR02611 family protein [Candidatus Saccharimonadales bacterium]|nr:TIGR02611 family protein [Candidatus Saccharimonadales bacterium]